MLQIKTIFFDDIRSLDDEANAFLATITTEAFRAMEVHEEKGFAIIRYELEEAWKNRLCSECKYWDDGGAADSTSGLCHECGKRRRFNCKACKFYKDVRG